MRQTLIRAILPVLSLGAIGSGLWMLSPAWSLIVVGGLLWIDLTMEAWRQKAS